VARFWSVFRQFSREIRPYPDFSWPGGNLIVIFRLPLARFRHQDSSTWEGRSVIPLDRTWQPVALCRGNHSHLFFPPSTTERKDERERREVRAKSICRICPVKAQCLDYATEIREPYGIWGGFTEAERRAQLAEAVV
jgi:WhiB family redox-sensing transcriptional regulator